MNLFVKDSVNNIAILAVSAGTPVTGLTAADFTLYASKNGGTPAAVSLTGLVTELDSVNTPGLYDIAVPSATFDTYGYITLHFSSSSFDTVIEKGDVGLKDAIYDIRALAARVGFSLTSMTFDGNGNMTAARINGFEPGADPTIATPRVRADMTATYNADSTLATFVSEEV